MTPYLPGIHTPEALASEIGQLYEQYPDTVLVGSLGRAVLHKQLTGNALAEFDSRRELPLMDSDNRARDIDPAGSIVRQFRGEFGPFRVDTATCNSTEVGLIQDGDDWFLLSELHRFSERVHPAVMEPQVGHTIFEIPATTIPAATHLGIYRTRGTFRPKDKLGYRLLAVAAADSKSPDERFYRPFDRLAELNSPANWLLKMHGAYRGSVPKPVREKLWPVMGKLRNVLIRF